MFQSPGQRRVAFRLEVRQAIFAIFFFFSFFVIIIIIIALCLLN